MAMNGGAASSYYNEGERQYPPPQQQYPMQNQGYQQNTQESQYSQPPPNYGRQDGQKYGANVATDGSKQTFDQAFALQRPKYNDLWAGILVRILGSSN